MNNLLMTYPASNLCKVRWRSALLGTDPKPPAGNHAIKPFDKGYIWATKGL